jgi:hypothetical protein
MTRLDWALVLLTLPYMGWVLLSGIFGIGLGANHAVAVALTFSAVTWPLLIWWMATGGAASALGVGYRHSGLGAASCTPRGVAGFSCQ